jgi:hypothetical protein
MRGSYFFFSSQSSRNSSQINILPEHGLSSSVSDFLLDVRNKPHGKGSTPTIVCITFILSKILGFSSVQPQSNITGARCINFLSDMH